jgi:hypothetical protein
VNELYSVQVVLHYLVELLGVFDRVNAELVTIKAISDGIVLVEIVRSELIQEL